MTRRATWTVTGAAAIGLMMLPVAVASPPVLVWNASASVPIGLYAVHPPGPLHIGQLVVAMPPEPLAAFLARRDYLPERVPLLKHVAALPGQQICRAGVTVTIDDAFAGIALTRDSRNRPLPAWDGCQTVARGEVFLMNLNVPDSLDGRYFGTLPIASIRGIATPIWTRTRSQHPPRTTPAGAITPPPPPAERTLP
ncbi:S26 family signal peptidase [Acidocella facilis]|uniref:S26 family signal peptidase n=1 Tax=Acidocella facilis TaxID=525 RepID=UPI001F1E17A8|nr:S26 family signal peptidase [Acidocella facilis]